VRFVLVDDCSTDGTSESVGRWAESDGRIVCVRNDRRLGLALNWRRARESAQEHFPGARYFAWGSDHDVWHHEWLEALVSELEQHPEAVLAYPESVRISERGEIVLGPWSFDTSGVTSPHRRLWRTFEQGVAGSMVYGLYRTAALARIDSFPLTVAPDRLILAQLSVHGEFRQVRRVLWQRRFLKPVTNAAQRASFFPDARPTLLSRLPWWLSHAVVLASYLTIRGSGRPGVGRATGLAHACFYALRGGVGAGWRGFRALGRRSRRGRRGGWDSTPRPQPSRMHEDGTTP
jgi:glycosyltransferase involved in cell wall biosynthesis